MRFTCNSCGSTRFTDSWTPAEFTTLQHARRVLDRRLTVTEAKTIVGFLALETKGVGKRAKSLRELLTHFRKNPEPVFVAVTHAWHEWFGPTRCDHAPEERS